MPDQITVQFGGREVVLHRHPKCDWRYENIGENLAFKIAVAGDGGNMEFDFFGRIVCAAGGDNQAAATALESKLRALRDELNRVLGG